MCFHYYKKIREIEKEKRRNVWIVILNLYLYNFVLKNIKSDLFKVSECIEKNSKIECKNAKCEIDVNCDKGNDDSKKTTIKNNNNVTTISISTKKPYSNSCKFNIY